jgi:mannose-1-phosphate guanylyltransferase
MKAQEYVHPGNPAKPLWSSTQGLLGPWSTEQILEEATACAVAERERDRDASRLKWLGPNPQTCGQALAAPVRAPHRWGVVLAGGDGVRLRELTRWLYEEGRPKQFCSLVSGWTLLEEARQRAERSIPAEQILFSLTRDHESYYRRYLADLPSQRIVQPFNKGTAPAILSALTHIAQADPEAIVSILPSDHYYSSERAFTAALDSALEIAERRTDSVVLLGAEPNRPEVDYGWIEIGEPIRGHAGLFRVEGFHEKPAPALAQSLLRNGSLWSTFVMVGHMGAFFEMAWATVPRLMEIMESMELRSHPGAEIRIPDSVYEQIAPTDFSRHILAFATDSLLAFQLKNLEWRDLGDRYRVLATVVEKEKNGEPPSYTSGNSPS